MDWPPGVAEDEEPVAYDIDEVGGDECPGDGADMVEGLQVAAEGEVEEERGSSPVECVEERDGAGDDVVLDGKTEHDWWSADDDEDESEGESCGEDEAVQEPPVGFVEAACAVRLGEVGVETKENACETEGDRVVEDLTQGYSGDGECWVGHVSDHDGVDDAHRHPANLSEDERQGEDKHGPDLASERHFSTSPPLHFLCKVFESNELSLDPNYKVLILKRTDCQSPDSISFESTSAILTQDRDQQNPKNFAPI